MSKVASNPERLLAAQMELGEAPVWDAGRNALFWMDIMHKEMQSLDWDSRRWEWRPLPALGGGLVLSHDGAFIAGLQTGIYRIDPDSSETTLIVDPEPDKPQNRLNEMKCDPFGRVWVGSMSTVDRAPSGSLWCLDRDHRLRRVLDDIIVPNALTWLEDSRHFLFADSRRHVIWKFRYDSETGNVLDRAVFVDCGDYQGIPDGCALDREGCVWVAEFGGGKVRRYDADAKLVETIVLPTTQVTSCAFAGPDLDRLVIVTAKRLLDVAGRRAQPEAGNLFVCEVSVPGLPPHLSAIGPSPA